MTQEQIKQIPLKFGEYWVKAGVNADGEALYELWGTTRVFDGEKWTELKSN